MLYYVTWEGIPIIDYPLRKRMLPDIKVTMMFVDFKSIVSCRHIVIDSKKIFKWIDLVYHYHVHCASPMQQTW